MAQAIARMKRIMKLLITCPCGERVHVNTLHEGKPVACPKCGVVNTLRLPVARIPPKAADASLPEWIVAPILGYLTLISGLIVLAGWWGAQLPANVVRHASKPIVEPEREIMADVALEKPVEAVPPTPMLTESDEEPKPSNESFVLPRRTRPMDDDLAPALETSPIVPAVDKPTPARSRLIWALDKPAAKIGGLMLPIETSRGEVGNLHYSVRRLRLDDDSRKPLRLGVTPVAHDDIGGILAKMGDGYRYSTLRSQDLMSIQSLRNFDVIFLTCADLYPQDFQAVLPLRKFVELGGTLYASDLRGDMVLAAFPEFRAGQPALPGVPQNVEASIVDQGLQSFMGRKAIPLTFEAPGWRPASFHPAKTTVCVQGAYRNQLGQQQVAPLLVKFRAQRGTVIFTSFHHSKNDSEIVRKLLDYLVFASVNAKSEARLRELMERYDFAPQDLRPVVLNADQKAQATHQHAGGGLQIALGFHQQGAKLKLTLREPTGQVIEHEDEGIYLIEVPKAPPGVWQYTVTPVELPHANFPIVVAVGTLKS